MAGVAKHSLVVLCLKARDWLSLLLFSSHGKKEGVGVPGRILVTVFAEKL